MKMCQPHWDHLRAEIEGHGLNHLVSQGGDAAVRQLMRQFDGTAQPMDFDPLMAANNQLWDVALNFIGLRVMEGDQCPACALRDYDWAAGAAYQSRLYAEQNGILVPAIEGDSPPPQSEGHVQ